MPDKENRSVEAVRLADGEAGGSALRPGRLLARVRGAWSGAQLPAFSYRVLTDTAPFEKRRHPRQRMRLRTGKIVDGRNAFLTEVRLVDRSAAGARLELVRAVALGPDLRLYDDETGALYAVEPVWRGAGVIGVLIGHDLGAERPDALARTHYALTG